MCLKLMKHYRYVCVYSSSYKLFIECLDHTLLCVCFIMMSCIVFDRAFKVSRTYLFMCMYICPACSMTEHFHLYVKVSHICFDRILIMCMFIVPRICFDRTYFLCMIIVSRVCLDLTFCMFVFYSICVLYCHDRILSYLCKNEMSGVCIGITF